MSNPENPEKKQLHLQEWEQATGIAKAFGIGRAEAGAVSALMTQIPDSIVKVLESAVKQRGMQRFMLHEVLSKGIFCRSWTSGSGTCEAWKDELRNREDNVLVFWLINPGISRTVHGVFQSPKTCFGFH